MLYFGYREGILYRKEIVRWREAYNKLKENQAPSIGGNILGMNRQYSGEVESLRAQAYWGRAQLNSL